MLSSDPCQTCGAEVDVVRVPGQKSIADTFTPIEEKRRCTNTECPTNTGQASLADVV